MKCLRSISLFAFTCLVIAGLSLAARPALAQGAYPNKQITFLVPFSAGGSTDLTARSIVSIASEMLGQPIAVVNKPGAGGATALDELAKAKPDGYTLGTINAIAQAISPHMRKVPFDPVKDFTLISTYGAYTTFIAVPANSSFKTLKDMIAFAKANPKALPVGVSSIGASSHLGTARLMAADDAKVTFVPFGGGAPAVAALLGGHIAATVVSGEILPHVRSGKVRLLGLLQDAKVKEFPDVPNIKELGYDWEVNSWLGIGGPAGMDPAVTKKLDETFRKAMQTDQFKKVMSDLAMLTQYTGHEAGPALLQSSYDAFGVVVKNLGIGLYAK